MKGKHVATFLLSILPVFILPAQNNDLFPDDEKQHNTPPETPIIIPEYDEQGLLAYLETFNSDDYEGIWTIRNDETKIAIEKFQDPSLNSNFTHCLIFLSSPSVQLKKGTIIGYIENSLYQKMDFIWLYMKNDISIKRQLKRYVIISHTDGVSEVYPNTAQRRTKDNEFPIMLIRDNPSPRTINKNIRIL